MRDVVAGLVQVIPRRSSVHIEIGSVHSNENLQDEAVLLAEQRKDSDTKQGLLKACQWGSIFTIW
jgi:hypothetical protein